MSGGPEDPYRYRDPFGATGQGVSPGSYPPPAGGPFGGSETTEQPAGPAWYGPPGEAGPGPFGGQPTNSYPNPQAPFGPGGGGFGAFPTAAASTGRTPVVWLCAGLVLALAAVATALYRGWDANGQIGLAVAAWLAAGPVAIGLLAVHSLRDTQQRARPIYTMPTWMPILYWAVVVSAAAGVVVSAISIALWAGRQ